MGVFGDVHVLEFVKFEPGGVIGGAVDFVMQLAARQFDREEDAHRVDLVAVIAPAHVARHAEQDRVMDHEAGLFAELADEGVFGSLTKVDAAAG